MTEYYTIVAFLKRVPDTVCPHLENFPRLSQVVVFRIEGLSDGPRTVKIVNKSPAGAVFDAFRVYGR
jgi:hypothetical protein